MKYSLKTTAIAVALAAPQMANAQATIEDLDLCFVEIPPRAFVLPDGTMSFD